MPWFTDTKLIPSGGLTQPDSAEPLTPGLGSILTPGPAGFWKSLPSEGPIQRPEHGVEHWHFLGREGCRTGTALQGLRPWMCPQLGLCLSIINSVISPGDPWEP